MPVIDLMLSATAQTWQRFDLRLGVPDFKRIGKDPYLNLLANQTAVHRVSIALHPNQAASIDANVEPGERVETIDVERWHGLLFLCQTLTTTGVAKVNFLLDELHVVVDVGKVTRSPHQQRLFNGVLDVTMR